MDLLATAMTYLLPTQRSVFYLSCEKLHYQVASVNAGNVYVMVLEVGHDFRAICLPQWWDLVNSGALSYIGLVPSNHIAVVSLTQL
jgi:hypothetical protein